MGNSEVQDRGKAGDYALPSQVFCPPLHQGQHETNRRGLRRGCFCLGHLLPGLLACQASLAIFARTSHNRFVEL